MKTNTLGTLTPAWIVAAAIALSPAVGHALECGDTILPGQKVKLEANVGPCTRETGGITVIGPAKLDLNGFAVTCLFQPDLAENPRGIRIIGERAKVTNGRVVACRTGVLVEGQGRHKITRVQVALSAFDGFFVHSSRNVLKSNSAIRNHDDGFEVGGERNVVKKNASTENERFGFYVRGHGHRIIRNEAIDDAWGGLLATTTPALGRSVFLRNVASSPDGEYDITLSGEACDDIWKGNLYGSAGHTCVQ